MLTTRRRWRRLQSCPTGRTTPSARLSPAVARRREAASQKSTSSTSSSSQVLQLLSRRGMNAHSADENLPALLEAGEQH